MNRRGFLTGMAGILASGFAPAVLPSGVIMPIRKIWTPQGGIDLYTEFELGPLVIMKNFRIFYSGIATHEVNGYLPTQFENEHSRIENIGS